MKRLICFLERVFSTHLGLTVVWMFEIVIISVVILGFFITGYNAVVYYHSIQAINKPETDASVVTIIDYFFGFLRCFLSLIASLFASVVLVVINHIRTHLAELNGSIFWNDKRKD